MGNVRSGQNTRAPSKTRRGVRIVFMLNRARVIPLLMFFCAVSFAQNRNAQSQVSFVKSKDGTRIALECLGDGPTLLIVHGGSGDRNRWKPLLPLFASHFKA